MAPRGTNGLGGLAYVNVISPDEVASAGKAIIIAGGKSLSDPGPARHRLPGRPGLSHAALQGLLEGHPPVSLLRSGPGCGWQSTCSHDIDGAATLAAVADAFTNWVGQAPKLLVYLVDHGEQAGGQGDSRLNSGGTAGRGAARGLGWTRCRTAAAWTRRWWVMDFCYAGSFLDELALPAPPLAGHLPLRLGRRHELQRWMDCGTRTVDRASPDGSCARPARARVSSSPPPPTTARRDHPHIDTGGASWGMYASGNSYATAFRGFGAPLGTNEDLTLAMDNGWIDNGETVGAAFLNEHQHDDRQLQHTGARLEFFFQGGSNYYFVVDSLGRRDTGIGFTDKGLDLRLSRPEGPLRAAHHAQGERREHADYRLPGHRPAPPSPLASRSTTATPEAMRSGMRTSTLSSSAPRAPSRAARSSPRRPRMSDRSPRGRTREASRGAFFLSLVQGAGIGQAFLLLARDAVDNYQSAHSTTTATASMTAIRRRDFLQQPGGRQ